MAPRTGTLLIARDIGSGWGRRQAEDLARSLEARLKQTVILSDPENSETSAGGGLEALAESGVRRIVLLPLGLLPFPQDGALPLLAARARRQRTDLSLYAADPLTWLDWSRWLGLTATEAANDKSVSPMDAGVLLIGSGSTSPAANADLARLAQLVQESSSFEVVRYAFLRTARPGIPEALRTLSLEGRRNVVAIPWLLNEEDASRSNEELSAGGEHHLNVLQSAPSLAHPSLVNLLVSNHYAALFQGASEYPSQSRSGDPAAPAMPPGLTPEDAFGLKELEQRINSMLPSQYRGRYETVSGKSMGSAKLKYDSDGKVAWGEIWTSFCDLALAGGPPHRGTLLEAVTTAEALAEPEKYEAVVAEIERGIRLVTSLQVVTSPVRGWVGVRCESDEMAIWLMRAIIVENIMVRREKDVLYLPAGPGFTVQREIKNVVTAVAKTVHYWSAHLMMRRAHAGPADS